MARPWPKRSAWPYVAKSGRKSYAVGFYDHDRRERSRSFASVRHARGWMDAIEDLRRQGPRPVDVEWRAARAAQADHDATRARAIDAPPERKLRGQLR